MIFELVIILVGLASGFVLTSKQLALRRVNRSPMRYGRVAKASTSQATEPVVNPASNFKISVIVPLLKDLDYLPTLMTSLYAQSRPADEIIVVGDSNSYLSMELHNSGNFRYLQTSSKSNEASQKDKLYHDCLAGALASTGDLLVFLTSDVHLEREAIELMLQEAASRLSMNHSWHFDVIGVQPFYEVISIIDHSSLFTLLINAFGKRLCHKKKNDLIDQLNPVAFVARDVFLSTISDETSKNDAAETHDSNLQPVEAVDDVSQTHSYYLGGQDIRFHPGGGRFHQLMQFLSTSTAPCILRLPALQLAMVALWLIACTSIVIGLIQTSLQTDALPVLIYLALYLLTLLQLNLASRHVGRFSKSAIFFFPVWLAAFWIIFAMSLARNYIFDRSKSTHKEIIP